MRFRVFPKSVFRLVLTLGVLSTSPGWAESPPVNVPIGSIVGFVPERDSAEYSDLDTLRSWLKKQGWALCDGRDGTPDLHNRYLLGTEQPESVGQRVGSSTHSHRVTAETGQEQGRERRFNTGAFFRIRLPYEGHKHSLDTESAQGSSLPPSLRVLFIIRTR